MESIDLMQMELTVPLEYVILYVLALTLCLFLRRNLLGIILSYIFVLYMGFFYNPPFIEYAIKGKFAIVFAYICFGILILVLAIIGVFRGE